MAKIRDGFYNDGTVMKYSRTLIPLICVMLFVAANASGSFAPFAKYRFEDGGYRLVAAFEHHNDHALQKQVGEFYTDDLAVLNEIKRDWSFTQRSPLYACGYHYFIVLMKDGKRVDDMSINLDCNSIVTADGPYRFPGKLLTKLRTKVRPVISKTEQFDDLSKARAAWDAYNKNAEFIYAYEPKWLRYEGTFVFKFPCPAEVGCSNDWDKNTEHMRRTFAEKFSDRDIAVRQTGSGGGKLNGYLTFEVTSTRAFYDSFDLFPTEREEYFFGKWRPFDLWLTTHWKKPK